MLPADSPTPWTKRFHGRTPVSAKMGYGKPSDPASGIPPKQILKILVVSSGCRKAQAAPSGGSFKRSFTSLQTRKKGSSRNRQSSAAPKIEKPCPGSMTSGTPLEHRRSSREETAWESLGTPKIAFAIRQKISPAQNGCPSSGKIGEKRRKPHPGLQI